MQPSRTAAPATSASRSAEDANERHGCAGHASFAKTARTEKAANVSSDATSAHGGKTARVRRIAKTAMPYAAAFLIPFVVLLAAFAAGGIYPFGSTSVMLYDMPLQYVDYFGWFSDVLRGNGNLLYSNAAGLGGGMFSLFSYYLSSPFNLLAAFWQPQDMPKFFSVLYLLKIPAGALTCLALLRGRFFATNAKNFAEARIQAAGAPAWQQAIAVLLACSYALSGYVLGYASNIMWLDGVIMLPLAALGAYRLVQRGTCVGLFAGCTAAVLFNWYTGYMVCLFCVLYFFCELARAEHLRGKRLATCVRCALTMLLAVGASLVVLLPTALSLLGGKGGDLVGISSVLESLTLSHNPVAVPNLFCIGTIPGANPHGNTPAVVISTLALVGLGVFFANGAVSKRAKIASGVLFAVMASSLMFPFWTVVWSGFVMESSYLNRNGFAILLTLVLLAAEGLLKLNGLGRARRVRAVALGGGAMTVLFALSAVATWVAKGEWRPSFELAMLEIALLAGFTVLGTAIAACSRENADADEGSNADEGVTTSGSRNADADANACNDATAASDANLSAHAHADAAAKANATPQRRRSNRHRIAAKVACCALAALFAGEQVYATYLQLTPCCYPVDGYEGDVERTRAFYQQLPALDKVDDNGNLTFARVANAAPYWGSTKTYGPDNMALLLGYSTFDHYSSTQESRIQELLAALGYSKHTPVGTYYQSANTVVDALLGVTHIIDDEQPADTTIASDETLRSSYHLYANNLALPLAWGTTGSTSVNWEDGKPFANQSAMLSDAADHDADVFATPDVSENENDGTCRSFTITPAIDGPVMMYTPSVYLLDLFYDSGIMCDVYVDGRFVQTIGGRGSFNEVSLGYGHAGQALQVTLIPYDTETYDVTHKDGTPVGVQNDFWDVSVDDFLQVVSVNEQALTEQLSRIESGGSFALSAYDNGHIAGTFTATQDETLVISQPFEDGWTVTVNGEPAELEPAYDGLMGVHVSAGENTIELHYLTPGLVPGAIVSIASVTLFGVWRVAARRRSMKQNANA